MHRSSLDTSKLHPLTLESDSDVVPTGWTTSVAKEASNSQSDVGAAGLVAIALKEGAGLATLEAKPGAANLRETSILGGTPVCCQ